jgi:ribokinase
MKILTVGGATIDTIAVVESDRIERMNLRNAETAFLLLEEGRKVEAADISTHTGGGAVNAAVGMARLGHDVSALVKLGQDARADQILSRLAAEGVSTRYALRDPRAPTGAAVLLAAHDRNAAIFTFRGANTLLEEKDLKKDAFAADLVYISSLSNDSADRFPMLIDLAKGEKALVATNPGIRQLTARGGAFQECLARIDILSINRAEADVLVPQLVARFGEGGPVLKVKKDMDPPPLLLRGFEQGGFRMTLARFLACVRSLGPRWVVVTDGRNGSFVADGKGIHYCPILPDVKVASTAGAGDAFASTLSASIAEGLPVGDAMLAAACNAASVVAKLDTQSGLMKREALLAAVEAVRGRMRIRTWEA